ncbi:MBL fold metallo-hydrolase [Clostridia bacterium]|nr:MBL fold metallo-hydrolase [Clostridia bacterium]GHV32626.1 MBL fold metallo-hydrolase [Clostridia bacterium]
MSGAPFAVTLRSGSTGNASLIYDGENALMVDCGIGFRALSALFDGLRLPMSALRAICLTHEHGDHTSLLRNGHRLCGVEVIASAGTLDVVSSKYAVTDARVIGQRDTLRVGAMTVKRFNTPHDANESCGYTVKTEELSVGVCTDLGEVPRAAIDSLCGCEYVIIESNHDVDMLRRGSYPPHLRRRILSRFGHLSNDDCAAAVTRLAKSGTRRVTLAHLSDENNDPSVALGTVIGALTDEGLAIDVDVAPRYEMGEKFCCTSQSPLPGSWINPIGARLAMNT